MVKSPKGKPAKDAQPEVWVDGRQHAPLETDHLARVMIIIARRAAASALNRGSIFVANASIAVEDGFGQGAVRRLGRFAAVLPPRLSVSLALARFSHLESKASGIINHVGEAVAPLEAGDLAGFMDAKRQEARLAAAERARKGQIARMAHDRAAKITRRAASRPLPMAPDQAEGARPVQSASADSDEITAIRAALAAYSGPEPAPVPVAPEVPPARPSPSRSLFDHPKATNDAAFGLPRDEEVMAAARPASPFAGLLKLTALPSMALRGLMWALMHLWALAGPTVTRLAAWALAWGMFVPMLPVGLYRAVRAHLSGQDLRYFD